MILVVRWLRVNSLILFAAASFSTAWPQPPSFPRSTQGTDAALAGSGQISILQQWAGDVGTYSGTTPTYKDHPDAAGDAGPNNIVHITGQDFIVYDLSGNILQQISTPQFFKNAGGSVTGIADEPRIIYDRFIQRWIATTCDTGTGNDYVAVSAGSDPRSSDTTAWKLTTIVPSGVNDDFLRPAYDKNGVYVSSYGGSAGGDHDDLNIFSPAALTWSGSGSIGLPTRITPIGFEYAPVTDTNPNKALTDPEIIWYRNPNVQNASSAFSLIIQQLTWNNGTPSLGPVISTATGFQYNTPVTANQPGGGGIRSVESHRGAAYAAGGIIYAMFSSGPCSSPCTGGQPVTSHNGFFWLKFQASDGVILDQGFEFDSQMDYLFSDVVVDANGNIVLTTTCSDANTTYPSACVFYRLPTDPAGQLTGPIIVKPGVNTYPGGCGGVDPPGWGLWSTTATDFSDGSKLWLFAEYGEYAVPCKWATRVMQFQVATVGSTPTITNVVNGANFAPGFSSSSWITIQGTNLSQTTRTWQTSDFVDNNLPTQLDGVSAMVNSLPAYPYYISPTQLNVLAPDDPTTGEVQIQVTNGSALSNSFTANKMTFSPALFEFTAKYPAAVHSNGAYVGPAGLLAGASFAPAAPGETIMVFGTGFGSTSPALPAGQIVSQDEPLANAVTVTLGGQPAAVAFAGVVMAGLVQLNVTVPADLPDGDAALVVTVSGVSTQAGQFIAVHH